MRILVCKKFKMNVATLHGVNTLISSSKFWTKYIGTSR
jgi:hypothetical protein